MSDEPFDCAQDRQDKRGVIRNGTFIPIAQKLGNSLFGSWFVIGWELSTQ